MSASHRIGPLRGDYVGHGYRILVGDVLTRLGELADESVHCVVTSPPYWGLRDYKVKGQIGLEKTPELYLAKMVEVFRAVRRVLRKDGTCWVNMGDGYASSPNQRKPGDGDCVRFKQSTNTGSREIGSRAPQGMKPKDLIGMPWMLAFALRADGWWLRQDIIWSKPNPMPESVTDRCTKAHEYLFLLTKSATYFCDMEAIKEPANGWNDSAFEDGKNAEVHPNVGKKRAHPRGPGNKSHKGTQAYLDGAAEHLSKAGLLAYSDRQRAIGVGPKSAEAGSGIKANESFSAAVVGLVQTRNKRSVWEIATQPIAEAHFATFPQKLVEPCILAGTSAKGCCEACGAPWKRVVETKRSSESGSGRSGNRATGKGAGGSQVREEHDIRNGPTTQTETVGWKASCSCGGDLKPCTVLDPFNGSGRTGLVAVANRCEYIGIELNPEYAAMSERRLLEATAQAVLL